MFPSLLAKFFSVLQKTLSRAASDKSFGALGQVVPQWSFISIAGQFVNSDFDVMAVQVLGIDNIVRMAGSREKDNWKFQDSNSGHLGHMSSTITCIPPTWSHV